MRYKQREVLMSKMEQFDQSSADDGENVRFVEDSCCTNKMSQKRKLSLEEKSVDENENKKLRIYGKNSVHTSCLKALLTGG